MSRKAHLCSNLVFFCSQIADTVIHMNNKEQAERFGQTVAAQLRAEAAAQRIPVVQLAKITGINRETLDRWLKGERSLSIPTLYRVATALNLDPSVIVLRAEERFEAELPEHTSSKLPVSIVRTSREDFLATVPLEMDKIAATTDNSNIPPDRGEA